MNDNYQPDEQYLVCLHKLTPVQTHSDFYKHLTSKIHARNKEVTLKKTILSLSALLLLFFGNVLAIATYSSQSSNPPAEKPSQVFANTFQLTSEINYYPDEQ